MRFSRSDAAAVSLVLIFSAVLLLFFLRDVNRVAERNGGVALGTVMFRKNTASRRADFSMRWERLLDAAIVYRGDTIRTGDLSEANIKFDDGSSLSLYENAMIRIDTAGSTQSFEIIGGAIRMTGGSGENATPRVIRAGKSVIDISSGAEVSINTEGSKVTLDVTAGSAKLVSPDGVVSKISGNETLNLDTKSNAASIVQRTIAPVYPASGARFVSSADGEEIVLRARPAGETGKYFFEISKDARFASVEKSETATASPEGIISASVGVTFGSWYWRIRAESGEMSSVSRFSVLASRSPELLWPEDRASIRFRKNVSPVGFSWTESPGASSYTLEISRDSRGLSVARKLSSALPGITVTDLAEGAWFWRAIPVFPEGTVGTVEASALREITVTRSGEMRALRQIVPADGGLYEIRNGSVNDIGFSWEPEADAVTYEISLFSAADRLTPLATYPTDRTWLSLDAVKSPFLAKTGSYFWSVSWKDAEGNVSPVSDLRRIDGVDGRSAIRPVFPPDGYTSEESLVPNIRFVWKSNMNARTVLQLSQDPSFAKVSAEKNATGNFLEGLACKAGMWYWRLVSYNADGSVFLVSESRSLRVALPFGSPLLERPAPGSAIEVLDGNSVKFSWTRIGGADYYSCKLYSPDAASAPVFSAEYLDGHECEIPLGTFSDGTYRVALQAFARDSESGTRIVGIPGSIAISTKKNIRLKLSRRKTGRK